MTLRGVEFGRSDGEQVRESSVTGEGKGKVLTVSLAEAVHDGYVLTVLYEQRFEEKDGAAVVGLIKQMDVAGDQGSVGLEVHGGGYDDGADGGGGAACGCPGVRRGCGGWTGGDMRLCLVVVVDQKR